MQKTLLYDLHVHKVQVQFWGRWTLTSEQNRSERLCISVTKTAAPITVINKCQFTSASILRCVDTRIIITGLLIGSPRVVVLWCIQILPFEKEKKKKGTVFFRFQTRANTYCVIVTTMPPRGSKRKAVRCLIQLRSKFY